MAARTIDDVIQQLTEIIDYCRRVDSRNGYFPAMYRKVTVRVKEGIAQGRFDDGDRMERLDVVFANRYLEAFRQYREGRPTSRAWAYAFTQGQETEPMIVQHLLLGMNAHINLDLGIAAAQVCQECELEAMRDDFFRINDVLAGLLDEVQGGVNAFSSFFGALDWLGGKVDEAICNFSIRKARESAWHRAQELHGLPPVAFAEKVDELDASTARLARLICPPIGEIVQAWVPVGNAEQWEPRRVIEALM